MDVLNPLADTVLFPHSGTFSANPVTMVAGLMAMMLFDEARVARLNRLGELARSRINDLIVRAGLPMCVTGAGSMFRIHTKPSPPRNYREAYSSPAETNALRIFLRHLRERGILLIGTGTGMLSTPMNEQDIDRLGDAVLSGLGLIEPLCRDW
jgi:glutamate-1-semialdehyde 2,1-aminomutase